MSNPLFLRISPADNVLVALRDIAPGEILLAGDREVAVQEHIPALFIAKWPHRFT